MSSSYDDAYGKAGKAGEVSTEKSKRKKKKDILDGLTPGGKGDISPFPEGPEAKKKRLAELQRPS